MNDLALADRMVAPEFGSDAGLVWAWVFAGLAVFFIIVSRRVARRGYVLMGLVMASAATASLLDGTLRGMGPGLGSLILARIATVFGLGAASFNLHFLCKLCERRDTRRVAWLSYVFLGAAALVILVSTVAQAPQVLQLKFPGEYQSPSNPFSGYVVLLLLGHYLAYVVVLLRAVREGRRRAFGLFLCVLALLPAVAFDSVVFFVFHEKWFIAEVAVWFYCLVILGGLLTDIQGAEGLLKETSSSLAERTAELEISYAEIDMMHSELSKKQQLAAVGELAAAIAHEVRNPLAVIMNAVSAMRRPTLALTDRETLLSIVNEESERLNHLVTELLRFARPVAASPGPASLLDICIRASQNPPEGYELKVSAPDHEALGPVLVDPGLFRLALDNLVANSTQAMPHGGTIELSVHRGSFSDGTPAAAVDIRDSGCGMRPDELEKAVKPFFTTKPRGTGLGIPIAERIVDAHGGEMTLKSELGLGTTVTINLPIEKELLKPVAYPGSKHPSTRRRLRSIPPGNELAALMEKAMKENKPT